MLKSSVLVAALGCVLLGAFGCRTTNSQPSATAPADLEVTETEIVLPPEGDRPQVTLSADLYTPAKKTEGVTVVVVPGAGRVSKRGERRENGSRDYDDTLLITQAFAESFARAGLSVLAYDKRTCGPSDAPHCHDNPRGDLDREGPVAMAKDVDAACALVATAGDRPVLFAHGQAAQVALASSCAKEAAAIVLVGPMPDAVDAVIVRGLSRRAELLRQGGEKEAKSADAATKKGGEEKIQESLALKNRAADLRDTFALLRAKKFDATAQVLGATPAFWLGWMELTENTRTLVGNTSAPIVIALGQWDSQYAPADKRAIERLAASPERFVVVDQGDHYLVIDGKLDPAAHAGVVDALLKALQAPSAQNPS